MHRRQEAYGGGLAPVEPAPPVGPYPDVVSLTDHIDGYCERTDASLWSEPVNAVTNLSFVVAAILTWRMARATGDRPAQVLAVCAGSIGVGSWLFHTVATRWTMQADVWPIRAFVLLYVALAVVRFLGASRWAGLAAAGAFAAVTAATIALAQAVGVTFNGSIGYAPVPVAILVLAALVAREDRRTARAMVVIAAVFIVSLGLRTVDGRLCAALPLGTHFGWHLLNGVVAGAMIVLFIRRGRAGRASSGSPRVARHGGSPAPR